MEEQIDKYKYVLTTDDDEDDLPWNMIKCRKCGTKYNMLKVRYNYETGIFPCPNCGGC
jgi:hypothetical protein